MQPLASRRRFRLPRSIRLSIREQLILLVVFCSLIAIAVVSVATWVVSSQFVVGVTEDALTLTAALYASQLLTSIALLHSSVQAVTTRVLIQAALKSYDSGQPTNFTVAANDLAQAISSTASQYIVQAVIFARDGDQSSPISLLNATSTNNTSGVSGVLLPQTWPNGSYVMLGEDGDVGYPAELYPNITYGQDPTTGQDVAFFMGEIITNELPLVLGPLACPNDQALISITTPVLNTTNTNQVLGYLTGVLEVSLLYNIQNATQGLGNTGVILLFGPDNPTNRFLDSDVLYNNTNPASQAVKDDTFVRFLLPPARINSDSINHSDWMQPFPMKNYPAVLDANTVPQNTLNNAGALLDSTNEEGDRVAVGFAAADRTRYIDWTVVVERKYVEVQAPLVYLRNVLIACLFGSLGFILLIVFPIAHMSSRPIRRLRDATVGTIVAADNSKNIKSSALGPAFVTEQEKNDSTDGSGLSEKHGKQFERGFWAGLFYSFLSNFQRSKSAPAPQVEDGIMPTKGYAVPKKVQDRKHYIHDELTDLTTTFNKMTDELSVQYEELEERVRDRTAELEASKKAAEAANEAKTQFIANISHELKTPLNGILGMCAVCKHEEDIGKIKHSLDVVYRSGDHLLRLLTDLLMFSKNQMGQQLTRRDSDFCVNDIAQQVVASLGARALEGNIDLRIVYEGLPDEHDLTGGIYSHHVFGPPGTGIVKDMVVYGDPDRILQIVTNLVGNGIKFTPPNGVVTLKIRCLGDGSTEREPSSRKGSAMSKPSILSKKGFSSLRRDRSLGQSSMAEQIPLEPIKIIDGSDSPVPISTALHINARDARAHGLSMHSSLDGSSSPITGTLRVFIFEFEVEDTGPGIAPDQRESIFEPFVQGSLGLNRKFGGTGLGLSICSQLATLLGGDIRLKSEVDHGSTFTVRIPLKYIGERRDSTQNSAWSDSRRHSLMDLGLHDGSRRLSVTDMNSESVHNAERIRLPQPVEISEPFKEQGVVELTEPKVKEIMNIAKEVEKTGRRLRVLVAEDNKVNQEVVLRMLKLEDISDVTVAKDGQEALDAIKEGIKSGVLPHIIFMDVQMPNLDGLQATKLIRSAGFTGPIVALTAFAEESNQQDCLNSGMDFFLSKPIKRPALKQVLKRYCTTIPEVSDEDEKSQRSGPTPTKEKSEEEAQLKSPKQAQSQPLDTSFVHDNDVSPGTVPEPKVKAQHSEPSSPSTKRG